MEVVLLCGGKGTRLQEHTVSIPKPLIEIGGYPILWHVMRYYSHYGHPEFVLALGYMASRIKEFFVEHQEWRYQDFRLQVGSRDSRPEAFSLMEEWDITFADTGLETNTGGRIKRVERYMNGDTFMASYSDGLADIDLNRLLEFHGSHGKAATLTAVNPESPFGILEVASDGRVRGFREKPRLDSLINGGFFVFDRSIFGWLGDNDVLETDTFPRLAEAGELMAYQHAGFWACMDTYKHSIQLNTLWETEQAPWKVWTG
jgi:glucose-1-phosphate cytidylyltransferase